MTPARQALIDAVKAHALANYEEGGWDVVVECYSDEDIDTVIAGARTVAGALRKFSAIIDVYADRQADAVNSAF